MLRIADGRGGSRTEARGFADDHDEPDGNQFLDYWQAQERAKITARRQGGVPGAQPLTVRLAAETYLDWLTAKNPRTAADTRGRLKRHFLPRFGDRSVTSLTKTVLDRWLALMARSSPTTRNVSANLKIVRTACCQWRKPFSTTQCAIRPTA